jgi:TonB-dependent starch-binding outer membrane protein SusC
LRIRSSIATAVALALAVAQGALAQQARQITGRVVDADDKTPIPEVQVSVLGTTLGAVTNDSGRFTLRHVPADAKTLNVRRIGYRGITVELAAGQNEYNVPLTRDVLQLEQEVVTGVATTVSTKNAPTYDPVVTGEQLNGAPAATVENALQGKVAGVTIEQNSGAPGGGLQVNIRGVTSILGNSEPLYVVDGVIVSNFTFPTGLNAVSQAGSQNGSMQPGNQDQAVNRIADLNPNDIESIQVLQGAAASSIYGSRAAAGVIVITTKRGSTSKPEIDFTQKFGTYNLENELDARHFSLSQADVLGADVGMTKAEVASNYNACHSFCDLQAGLYGGGELSNESDLSIRGGAGGSTTYFLSGQFKYDNGAQINTGYNKQTARANLSQTIFGTITAAANIAYTSSLTRTGVNGNDNLGIAGYDVLSYTPSFFCMACHVQNAGYVTNPFGPANAFQDASDIQTPDEVSRTTLSGTINWKLFTASKMSLELALLGGADFVNERDQLYAPPDLQVEQSSLVTTPGVSTSNAGYDRLSNYAASLIHHWTPDALFSATTSIGFTRDKDLTYQAVDAGSGLVTGNTSPTSGTVQTLYNFETESNNTAFYGQEQLLLFSERLGLTGGINSERSTSNGNIDEWYTYPKVAGSFQVFRGDNELKLRAAYGQSGNLPVYGIKFNTVNSTNYSGISGLGYSETAGEPNVRPETNTSIETGFDLTLFKGRVSLNGTVFQKRITNLLLPLSVLPSSGFTTAYINGGQLTNQGLEAALSATPVQLGKFTWTSTETFTRVYDRVDNLPVPPFEAGNFFGYFPFGGYYIQQGASVNAIYGYPNAAAGASQTLEQMGNVEPAWSASFGQDLSYGPVHVHVLFDWRVGQVVDDLTQQYWDGAFSGFPNLPFSQGNLADTNGTKARYAGLGQGITEYVESASFLKLRELTARFDIPNRFIANVGRGYVRSADIVITGRNLVTWTKYPGLDPEVSNFGTQQLGRGQDVTPYPPTRSYFIGFDLGF